MQFTEATKSLLQLTLFFTGFKHLSMPVSISFILPDRIRAHATISHRLTPAPVLPANPSRSRANRSRL